MLRVKYRIASLCIKDDVVPNCAKVSPCIIVAGSPLPRNLILEVLSPKHGVHKELEVVAGCGVAVEVDAAGGLEDAAELDEAGGHHHQVGHHGVAADELAEGGNHVLDRRGDCGVADYVLFVG